MSYYRQQLEDWLSTMIVKADTVLDIGGAQGEVKSRVKSWDVRDYRVLDLPRFDIQRLSDARTIIRDAMIDPNGADIIFCLEVFEYLIKPYEAMESLYILLKEGGKAYVTFAFIYPHHNELYMDSLRYTEFGIRRLAGQIGLKVSNIWYRNDKSGLLQSFYASDGMHPAKEYQHHDATGFIVELTK